MSLSYRDRLEKRKELHVEAEQWKQAYDASLAERIRLEDAIEDLELKHSSLQQEAQEKSKLVDQLETSLKADREAMAKRTSETADVQKRIAELQKEKQSQEKVVQQAVRQLKTANSTASAKQEEIEAKKAQVQNRLDASERDMLQQLDSLRVELIDVRRRDADLRAATAAASSVETEVELLRFSAQQASVGGLKRSLLETMAASKQHCDKLQLLTAQVQYDKKQLLYMRNLVQSTVKVIREELDSLEADPTHEPPRELLAGEARNLTQYIMQREAIRPFERAEAADTPGHNHSFAHDLESGAMPVEVDADVASDLSRSRALLGSPDPANTSQSGGRGAPGSAGSRQGAGGAYGYKLNLQFEDSGYGPRFRQLEHAWVLGEGSIDADDEGGDDDTEGAGRPYGPGAGLDSESLMDGGAASTMSVGPSASVMTQGTSASGNALNAKSARAARAMRQMSNTSSQRRGTFFGMYTADHKKPAQRQARASTAGPVRAQNLMRRSFVLPGRQVSGLLDASTVSGSGGDGGGGASTYTASVLDVSLRHAAKEEWTLDDKIRAQFMQRRAKSAGPEGRNAGGEGAGSGVGAAGGAMGSPEGRMRPARRQSYAHVEPRYLQHLEQSDGEYTNSDADSDDENLDGKARKERKKRLASKKSSWRRGTFFGMYSKQSAHSADEADPGKAKAKKRQKKADKKKGKKKQAGMSKTVGSLGTLSETGDESDESQTTSGSNSDGGAPDDNAPLRARQVGSRGANTYRRGTFFGMYKPSEAANQSRSSSAGASSRRGRRGKRSESPKPSIVQPKWNTSTNQGSHNRKSKKSEVVARKRRNTLYAAYRLNLDLEEEESDENSRSRSRSKGSPGKSVIASMTSPITEFKKQAKQRRTSKAFERVKPRYLDALSKIEKQKSEAAKASGVVEEAEEKVVVKKLTSQRRGTFFGMYSKSASAEMRERQQQMILMSDPYRRGAAIKQSASSSPPAQGQGGKGGKGSGPPGVDTFLIPECRTQEVWLGALRTYEKSPATSRVSSPKLGPQSALTPRMRRLSTALSPSQQAHVKAGDATVVITGLKRAGRKITAPMEREDGRFVPLRNLTAAWHDTLRGTGGLSDRVAHHLEDLGDAAFAASPRSRNRSRASSFEEGGSEATGLGLGAGESRLKRSWSGRSSVELDAGEAEEAKDVGTPHRPVQANVSSPAVTDLLQRARTAFYSSDVPAQVASPQTRSPPAPSNGAGRAPRPYVHPTSHATHGGDSSRPAFTSPIQTSRGTQRMGKTTSPSYAQSSSRSPQEQPRVVQLSASSRRRGSYFGLYSPHQVAEVSNKQLRQEYKEDPTRLGSDVQDEVAADMERMRMKMRMQKQQQQQPAQARSPPQQQRGSYGGAW